MDIPPMYNLHSMFERFTDRARRVMTLASQEALRLGHDHVGTEHLLLGLVKESTGTAASILAQFHVDVAKIRQQVEHLGHLSSEKPPIASRSTTDRYQRVINHAIEEATALSKNYVGTEHLLLGLLHEPDGTAARVLAGLNLKLDEVRTAVLNLLGRATTAKDTLLTQAMKDLALHLADENRDPATVRAAAEALINAGWRPQQ